jgi:hypothetical protein
MPSDLFSTPTPEQLAASVAALQARIDVLERRLEAYVPQLPADALEVAADSATE